MSQNRAQQPEAWSTYESMFHYDPDTTGELAIYSKYYKCTAPCTIKSSDIIVILVYSRLIYTRHCSDFKGIYQGG